MTSVVAARLEPGDVGEDDAADRRRRRRSPGPMSASAGPSPAAPISMPRAPGSASSIAPPSTASTSSTRRSRSRRCRPTRWSRAKEMVATVKIIPFAVRREAVAACVALAASAAPVFHVAPFRAASRGADPDPARRASRRASSTRPWRRRARGSPRSAAPSIDERRTAHREARARAGDRTRRWPSGAEMVLIAGASAILDRRDVIPAAIVACGGAIEHFGMPVDPGNLMLHGAGSARSPVLGLPGCARSPRVNGFDWVLRRVLAGLPVDAAALAPHGRRRPARRDPDPPPAPRPGDRRAGRRRRRTRRASPPWCSPPGGRAAWARSTSC